jgi:hypothetical protein
MYMYPSAHTRTHAQSLYFRVLRYPYFLSVPLGLFFTYLRERRNRRTYLEKRNKKQE